MPRERWRERERAGRRNALKHKSIENEIGVSKLRGNIEMGEK